MAKVIVKLNRDFTTIPNSILRNSDMSLAAKGLLITMLSLPENWNYTIEGLSLILKEGKDKIRSTIKELEEFRYIKRERERKAGGFFGGMVYFVYQVPYAKDEEPMQDEPTWENPTLDKPTQLNKDILNTDKQKKDKSNRDLRIDNDLPFSKTESNIYTSVPLEAEEQSPDAPEETLIKSAVREVSAELSIDESANKDIADDINTIITAYGSLSTEKPRNITKSGLSKIIYSYLMPPDNMDDATADDYVKMINLYFTTDFNSRKRYKGKITRSIEHFMSDGIRSLLYERVRRNGST